MILYKHSFHGLRIADAEYCRLRRVESLRACAREKRRWASGTAEGGVYFIPWMAGQAERVVIV